MKDRILKFLTKENITPARFADDIGVQRSSVSHILSGRNNPSFDFIQKILQHYKTLSADWLILGAGEMYKKPEKLITILPNVKTSTDPPAENNLFSNLIEEKANPVNIPEPETKPVNLTSSKKVDKIIILYSDKSFVEYTPSS